MSIESVMLSNHIILCRLLLLPSIFPSISLFQWVGSSHHGQSIGASASAWVLPVNIQGWFPLGFFQAKASRGFAHSWSHSCLENPMDGGAWWAAVHGVAKSRTRLSGFTFTFHLHALEKEMATHASVLAWRIPGMGEPGGLPSMGSRWVGHDWSDLAAAAAALTLQAYMLPYQQAQAHLMNYKEVEPICPHHSSLHPLPQKLGYLQLILDYVCMNDFSQDQWYGLAEPSSNWQTTESWAKNILF